MRDENEKDVVEVYKNRIKSWQGSRKTGEWVRESVATNLFREYEVHAHAAESTPANRVIVKIVVRELVHVHHGYRPKLDGENKVRKSFWWRGARVWR